MQDVWRLAGSATRFSGRARAESSSPASRTPAPPPCSARLNVMERQVLLRGSARSSALIWPARAERRGARFMISRAIRICSSKCGVVCRDAQAIRRFGHVKLDSPFPDSSGPVASLGKMAPTELPIWVSLSVCMACLLRCNNVCNTKSRAVKRQWQSHAPPGRPHRAALPPIPFAPRTCSGRVNGNGGALAGATEGAAGSDSGLFTAKSACLPAWIGHSLLLIKEQFRPVMGIGFA